MSGRFNYLVQIIAIIFCIAIIFELQVDANETVSCVKKQKWMNFKIFSGTRFLTCHIQSRIASKGYEFSNLDQYNDQIQAISFSENQDISYLPDKIYEKYQKVLMFAASSCKIVSVEKSNFEKLFNLTAVDLSDNLLQHIPKDLFQDSQHLQLISFS